MFQVKVHKHIESIISFFYRVRIWHRSEKSFRIIELFYSIYFGFFPLSLITGSRLSGNKYEKIFSVQTTIMGTVLLVKLLYLIWRKRDILELINRICHYGVEDEETFTRSNDKLNILMKFVSVFLGLCYFCAICIGLVIPFRGSERQLFFKIGFPLDYRTNELVYLTAIMFIFSQLNITIISLLFSSIVWYLLANCALRYAVLGQQIKVMGERKSADETNSNRQKTANAQTDNLYLRDLLGAIPSHQYLKKLTIQLDSFLSKLFAVQLTTSGLCICASIYCLAFNRGNNLIEFVIHLIILQYSIFDIFMIMNFGNEIQLESDRLTYCLFESNWVDRSQPIKKNVLLIAEFLMKPHQLVVLKLYPLTLETFTRILNSAYSMFNILQNFK